MIVLQIRKYSYCDVQSLFAGTLFFALYAIFTSLASNSPFNSVAIFLVARFYSRINNNHSGLIHKYGLYISRRCFCEVITTLASRRYVSQVMLSS